MFIAPTTNPETCAPAERDVSGKGTRDLLTFRSSGARRKPLEDQAFYKHYVPTGRGKVVRKLVPRNKKLELPGGFG